MLKEIFNKIIFSKVFADVVHFISMTLGIQRYTRIIFCLLSTGGKGKLPSRTVNVRSRHYYTEFSFTFILKIYIFINLAEQYDRMYSLRSH